MRLVFKNVVSGWKDLWEKGVFPWHKEDINPKLEKYWSILMEAAGKSNPKECRFFVPLCGKTKDLLFLYSKGFQVIGCEGVHKACTDFFKGKATRQKGFCPKRGFK